MSDEIARAAEVLKRLYQRLSPTDVRLILEDRDKVLPKY